MVINFKRYKTVSLFSLNKKIILGLEVLRKKMQNYYNHTLTISEIGRAHV